MTPFFYSDKKVSLACLEYVVWGDNNQSDQYAFWTAQLLMSEFCY